MVSMWLLFSSAIYILLPIFPILTVDLQLMLISFAICSRTGSFRPRVTVLWGFFLESGPRGIVARWRPSLRMIRPSPVTLPPTWATRPEWRTSCERWTALDQVRQNLQIIASWFVFSSDGRQQLPLNNSPLVTNLFYFKSEIQYSTTGFRGELQAPW